MSPARLAAMPDWPARMTAEVAALFMCVSESTFLTRYGEQGCYTEGRNRFWPRAWLEQQIALQAGLPHALAAAGERDDSWDDLR